MSKRLPKPDSITIPLYGRDWYSLKNQAKGARLKPDEYIAWVLFRRAPERRWRRVGPVEPDTPKAVDITNASHIRMVYVTTSGEPLTSGKVQAFLELNEPESAKRESP